MKRYTVTRLARTWYQCTIKADSEQEAREAYNQRDEVEIETETEEYQVLEEEDLSKCTHKYYRVYSQHDNVDYCSNCGHVFPDVI